MRPRILTIIMLVPVGFVFLHCQREATEPGHVQYTIYATASPNGMISPSGPVKVPHGADQTFTMHPSIGFHVSSVQVDGVSIGAVNIFKFSKVVADHHIHATFAPSAYTILATAGPNGRILPSGLVGGLHGGNQTFTFIPDTGYHVSEVIVDSVSVGNPSIYSFVNITRNHTIEARFAIDTFTVMVLSGSNGRVTPQGLIKVTYGSSLKIVITPDVHFHIARITVDGISVSVDSTYTLSSIRQNHTIEVAFEIDTYTITVYETPNGRILPSGSVSVPYGSSQSFSILPDSGYLIHEVFVDGSAVGPLLSYTFFHIERDHTISAAFKPGGAGTLIAHGWQAYSDRDYTLALRNFENALKLDSLAIDGYNGAGWAHAKSNNLGNAVTSFIFGLRLDSTNADMRAGLAFVFQALGRYSESVELAKKVVGSDPTWRFERDTTVNWYDVRILLAQAYFAMADFDLSLEQVQILNPLFTADMSTIAGLTALMIEIERLASLFNSLLFH